MHKHAATNRFYRLVWSHVHSCWVAVAEGARGRGKSASRKLSAALIGALVAGGALAAPPGAAGFAAPVTALPATALPTGGQVVAGQASVSSAGNQMTVLQGSDKAILNWQSFDIGANAGVRFVQPSSNAVALNRVIGADPSRIHGQLSANGKVFLVNSNGVLFGATARVDVGGLVASSLALPDNDFLAGRYAFDGSGSAGAVSNEGSIRTASGGAAVLLGPVVKNSGSIVAPNGSVALAAGEQVAVDLRGDGLVTVRVDRGSVDAIVANSGVIQADGGRVELTAQGRDALARATVNNTGLVQARGIVADGGSIRLAGDGDIQAGALDASSSAGRGGQVAIDGRFVALDGAIDASGVHGGSVAVNAAGTLSTAAATRAGGSDTGGSIGYRSGGSIVESGSAVADASGTRAGGSIAVHGDGGVLSSASYRADATQGVGGRIDLSGADVRLFGAQLDAGGATQGGLVRVGGAFQGGAVREDAPDLARFVTRWGHTAPIANAGETFINDSSAIRVGASGANGQGGTAVVWSDRQTTMLGSIDARGAGAAGTVEISAKDTLRHVGLDRIALGTGGQLLLDPKNITIGTSSGAWTYQAMLGKGVGGGKNADLAGVDAYDNFGFSVALNAVGDRLAVGAPGDAGAANSGTARGAVHLFSFTDNTFSGASLQGTIGSGYTGGKNLNVALSDGDQFGSAVALNADATRLAVGAIGDSGYSGAAYLIHFGDTAFSAPAVTQLLGAGRGTPNLTNALAFGSSVALNASGDRLAVGALYDSGATGNCGNCGAVYLFNNALATPSFVKAIGSGYGVNMTLPTDAQFGTSVALDGTGDKLAVGAYGVDGSRGAVYLFDSPFGTTAHVATLGNGYTGGRNVNVALAANEGFGSSVALSSNGRRLAVGATGAGEGAGSVRIIDFAYNDFSGGAVKATLGSNNTEWAAVDAVLDAGENFGFALALNGAGDRLVAGSPLSDGDADDNGGYGAVRAFALLPIVPTTLAFGTLPNVDVTIDANMLSTALDNGTSITLQANNDITLQFGRPITVADGSGNGSLRLQAGRSIVLNSNITTGNANLTLVANDTVANGVVNAYRDSGAAVITQGVGTTINAGSGQVSMTIADGAGKTDNTSGAITIGGGLFAGSVSLKNLGTSANSNVVIGSAGGITANGLIELVTSNAGSTFINNRGPVGINPGAGRYLVYTNNPSATVEGMYDYNKHYAQSYTGAAPAYAAGGNWFLYSTTPTLTVTANPGSKTYDGTTGLPVLGYSASGYIDGDNASIFTGALGVTGLSKNAGTYGINAGTLGTNLGYAINYTGASFTVTPRMLNVTADGIDKTYDGNSVATVNFDDNRVNGDVLNVNGSASFADKNAGSGKQVNVTGITVGGLDAANYTLATNNVGTSASIYQRTLNASATGMDKTYDGDTAANVILGDDRVAGDILSLSASDAHFASKDAGMGKTVTVTGITLGGLDAANYVLNSGTATASANIGRRLLSASAVGIDKTYDGNSSASVSFLDDRVAGDLLGLSGNAGFTDKNAGNGKSISVTGITLGGLDAANYQLASTTASTSANIATRTLNVLASGVDKTYDGNDSASVILGDDRVNGDLLNLSGTASFADKHAGIGKTVSVTGLTLSGLDAANYTLDAGSATTSASISQRVLNAGAIGLSKTYDGGMAANVILSDDRVAGDSLYLTAVDASFADKNAGAGKMVSVSGIALGGADAANYVLASSGATATADIDRRVLTVGASGQDKVYDGLADAGVLLSDDRVAGDLLDLSAGASFADKHAGSGKSIAVTGITIGGVDALNYTLASATAATSASIAKRDLHAVATGIGKTYDGNAVAAVGFSDDRVAGDLLDYSASASFADKAAGNGKLVTVSGIAIAGQDAGNYNLVSSTGSVQADIAQRVLAVSALGSNKTYDGGTAAGVVLNDNRVNGDVLTVTGAARFADKNAGSGKTIEVSGMALDGQDAANYTLASNSATTSADIGKRVLNASVSALDKVYDGNDAAQFGMLDDRIGGDVLTVAAAGARFADKNVGSGKTVTVSGLQLSGPDAGNYTLSASVGAATASITPRLLNVSATGIDKVYDGTRLAGVTLGDDRVAGDLLGVSDSGAFFADKHAGAARTITVGGLSLSGLDAANYQLASTSTVASAAITPRTLNVSASGVDKVYDGGVAASVVLADDRLGGDQLAVARSARFADKNAGSGKAVQVDGLALEGQDAGNYQLASSSLSASAAITPRALEAKLTGAATKVYDGGTRASLDAGQVRLGGFVAGEGASVGALEGRFDSANVLQARGVQALLAGSAVTADAGTQLSNYLLPTSVSGAGSITPKAVAVTGMRASDKVYDGTTRASVAAIGSLDGLVAGESLQLGSPLAIGFATADAGSGKLVYASGYTLGDGANGLASNYALSGPATSNTGVVTQATLTVRATNGTRAAGLANPVFGYSVSGMMAGDSAAILPAFVTASNATPQSAPGDYAITIGSNATLRDYQLVYVDGVLTVTGAPPELTRTIRAAIAPVLPLEVGGGATVAQGQDAPQRGLPRAEQASVPATPVAQPGSSVLTLSGGTEIVTRNGGVRTAQ